MAITTSHSSVATDSGNDNSGNSGSHQLMSNATLGEFPVLPDTAQFLLPLFEWQQVVKVLSHFVIF